MQLTTTLFTAIMATTLSVTTASALAPPSSLNLTGNPFADALSTRSLKKMDGKCTKDGRCKVPGGLHDPYDCWSSLCLLTDRGKPCVIAPGINGDWVAKCPYNLLPYEWEWPWVDHSKDKKNGGN